MEGQEYKNSNVPQEVIDNAMLLCDLATDGLDDRNFRDFMKEYGRFPVAELPKVFQEYILQTSKSLAAPPEFVALSVLSVVSTALGNAYALRVKRTWEIRACIWVCIIGPSGSNKSASLKLPLGILKKMQAENLANFQEESAEYEYKMLQFNHEIEEWQKAVQAGDTDLSSKPEEPVKPKFKQLIVGDATMETIPDLAEDNPRGFMKVHGELLGFIKSMDQYRKGGGDRQKWLEIKDGEPINVNRKNREPKIVNNPFVNVIGTTQSSRLPELVGEKEGDKDDGFAQRFFYVYPDQVDFEEDDDYEVDEKLIQQYEEIIKSIYCSHQGKEDKPIEMGFTPEAKAVFSKFKGRCKDEMREPSFPGNLESTWNKLRGNETLKICIIIHAMRCFSGEAVNIKIIDEITVRKAITIMQYLKSQSRKVFTILNANDYEERIRKICEHMKRRARKTEKGYFIKVNDLTQGKPFGRETRAGVVKETLREMEKQGYGYLDEIKNANNKNTEFFTLKY
ncbi:DUF3987 domain-containing protein [Rossellomorea vietnamensis]|uniref:DUF3987 domain-containing protein n=1 Tax=Rossellomorea vietnamensis TaxID=218284 RepID=UPI00054E377F|nr:DUF3987 domain-containing protein [Rossellomorea vietnamensis]